ncbi:MAG: FAD-dependent oxidoreductase [Planctomycetes bacterium]|nr:FAD-dependent oxidoreductase [Planctomycetota bacterium]
MPVARVIMFSDSTSEACRTAKRVLDAHHISYTEKNLREDAESAAFVRKLCGAQVAPVFYVADKWLPDPTNEELLVACGIKPDANAVVTKGRTIYDVVVIGLGPAGLAACHGCRLGGLKVLGLDENEPGGHLNALTDVDEYLGVGYDEKISGADVAANFAAHAVEVGATLVKGKVTSIRVDGGFKYVQSSAGEFWARAVIVATGATHRELKINGVEKFLNRGIRYGAQVDAAAYQGKRVCVVGGGDEAMHAAIFIGQHAKHVTVLCPDDKPTAEPLLVERAAGLAVRILMGTTVEAVKGNEFLDYVFFKERGIDEEQGLPAEAMVIALGPAPRKPLAGLERIPQENGYFAHGEGGKTMISGIYVAGDCTDIGTRTMMGVVASGNLCARRVWQWLASHPLPRIGGR